MAAIISFDIPIDLFRDKKNSYDDVKRLTNELITETIPYGYTVPENIIRLTYSRCFRISGKHVKVPDPDYLEKTRIKQDEQKAKNRKNVDERIEKYKKSREVDMHKYYKDYIERYNRAFDAYNDGDYDTIDTIYGVVNDRTQPSYQEVDCSTHDYSYPTITEKSMTTFVDTYNDIETTTYFTRERDMNYNERKSHNMAMTKTLRRANKQRIRQYVRNYVPDSSYTNNQECLPVDYKQQYGKLLVDRHVDLKRMLSGEDYNEETETNIRNIKVRYGDVKPPGVNRYNKECTDTRATIYGIKDGLSDKDLRKIKFRLVFKDEIDYFNSRKCGERESHIESLIIKATLLGYTENKKLIKFFCRKIKRKQILKELKIKRESGFFCLC
jgi:hypothetical protein